MRAALAPHRYALETCITALFGDFRDPRRPKVVLSARYYVLDEARGLDSVALQDRFDISVPISAAIGRADGRRHRGRVIGNCLNRSPRSCGG
jgi:hypothetical protein